MDFFTSAVEVVWGLSVGCVEVKAVGSSGATLRTDFIGSAKRNFRKGCRALRTNACPPPNPRPQPHPKPQPLQAPSPKPLGLWPSGKFTPDQRLIFETVAAGRLRIGRLCNLGVFYYGLLLDQAHEECGCRRVERETEDRARV